MMSQHDVLPRSALLELAHEGVDEGRGRKGGKMVPRVARIAVHAANHTGAVRFPHRPKRINPNALHRFMRPYGGKSGDGAITKCRLRQEGHKSELQSLMRN